MIKHNKEVIVKPAYYEAEPNDSYQVVWLCDLLNGYRFSCKHIAEMLNVSRQTVNNWINDKAKMSYANFYALHKALNLYGDPNEIYQKMKKR